MAYYPFATEIGALYKLVGPDGTTAVFNDPLDPNYVGMLTDVTGLDSSDVRESASDLVEADGGQHGNFYFGRRPIVLSGRVFGHVTAAQRNARLDLARRASLGMRGDSILSWRPSNRRENYVINPRAVNDTSTWSAAATGVNSGATLTRVTAIAPPVGTTGFQIVTSGATNTYQGATVPVSVTAGKTYTISLSHIRTAGTGSARPFYVDPATASSVDFGSVSGGAWATSTFTFTATVSGTLYIGLHQSDSNTLASTFQFSDVMVTQGTNPTYFDGDSTGFYWQGNAHASQSGDFVEMATWVRRQQPFRESGNWVKDFQVPMVSQFAPLFSAAQLSTGSGSSFVLENRGSYPSYPILNLTGISTNPSVTVSGGNGALLTAGLTLASGETLQVDTLNHTAVFTAGTRVGQSGNRYIDFSGTVKWPAMPSGTYTLTLAGGGSFSVTWRDAWA